MAVLSFRLHYISKTISSRYYLSHSVCRRKSLLCHQNAMLTFVEERCSRCTKAIQDVLVEYEEQQFSPKVLMNEPGYRTVLLSLRARQNIPEHASRGIVTGMSSWDTSPYSRVLFPTNCMPDKSSASRAASGTESKHSRIQLCSFSSGGTNSSMGWAEELDLCEVPRLQRHLFESRYQRQDRP